MPNQILRTILFLSTVSVVVIFFVYKGFGWPYDRESMEACIAFSVFSLSTILHGVFLHKKVGDNHFQQNAVKLGLFVGILWSIEIGINNILRPKLPYRDIIDNIFWFVIALFIFLSSIYSFLISKKISQGIQAGAWIGFASGAVAAITALCVIVFGMSQILLDPLNVDEWSVRGASSGVPNIAVYFAYQTLAGAVLHLIVLGILMGFVLGLAGSIVGKIFQHLRD